MICSRKSKTAFQMFVLTIASVLLMCMYATLMDRHATLRDWEATLTEWNATLIEWNSTLIEWNATLMDRKAKLTERITTLREWNATLAERSAEVPVSLTLHQQLVKAMEGPYGLLPKNQDKNSKASLLSTCPQEVRQNMIMQGVQAIPRNEIFQAMQVAPQTLIFQEKQEAPQSMSFQEIQEAAQNKIFLFIENNGSSLAFFAVAVLAAIFGIRYSLLPTPRPRPTSAVGQPPRSTLSSGQSQRPRAQQFQYSNNRSARQHQESCISLVHHQPEAACNPRCEVFQRKKGCGEIDVEAALQTVLEMLQNGEVTECTMMRDGVVTTTSFKNNGDTIPSTLQSTTVSAFPGSPATNSPGPIFYEWKPNR